MPRTPLAHWLARRVDEAAALGRPPQVEAPEVRRESRGTPVGLSRRRFLRGAAASGVAIAGVGAMSRRHLVQAGEGPRIVIVGAGLAGLTCAYRLRQAGVHAEVHEASTRVGGRCWTLRGFFDEGQIAEHGGEFIDSSHTDIRRLVHELGLELDDVLAAQAPGAALTSLFQGHRYSEAQATSDIQAAVPAWMRDADAAGYPTTYRQFTRRGLTLDRTPLSDYLEQTVPGGRHSHLGQMLDIVYAIEYGADTSGQSALNFLYLIGYSRQRRLKLVGGSDERFHVRGGNDRIVHRLAQRLDGQIITGSALVAIERRADGSFRLAFDQGSATRTVIADRVVLSVPFAVLRAAVDYARAGFRPRKQQAIEELGMGTNSKLHLQFDARRWRHFGWTGETYSNRGYQSTWEVTRAQPGQAGILVDYTGGAIGASFGEGTPEVRARRFLAQIEPVVPGLTKRWNGRASVDFWLADPFTRGSYSYWKVGQYTRFAGFEKLPEGACHFAGEHTSINAQGYLDGAVISGNRAAKEVLAALTASGSR